MSTNKSYASSLSLSYPPLPVKALRISWACSSSSLNSCSSLGSSNPAWLLDLPSLHHLISSLALLNPKSIMKAFCSLWLFSGLYSSLSLAELQRPLRVASFQPLFTSESTSMRCATMGCNSSNLSLLSPVDLLFLDASELQTRLTERKLTSVQLAKAGLEQIRRENHQGLKLNAIISTPPVEEVIKLAEELDREREQGRVRGPLHGITIIVKDAIGTHPELKMVTTCGSYALKTSVVAGDSQVIEKLRKAGVLILGKANLTEFCQMKGDNITTGWSAVGGQTTSAYIEGGIRHDQGRGGPTMPGGSSTGSAVGVSAGFSPIALGTETDGSVIQPANRAALFAIKPSHGMVSLEGACQMSTSFDVIGPMAKSAGDLANLLNVIVKNETANYPEFLTKSFANLRLGFVDPDIWRFPDAYSHPVDGIRGQMRTAYLDAKSKIETLAKKVEYPISIVLPEDLNISGQPSISNVITYEYGPLIDSYLKNLTESEVRSLDELIKWNEAPSRAGAPRRIPQSISSGRSTG
ncbi:hypothetical protein VN97_g5299 [Penicillium thymicola]|uniref:Amidase domain-containing protein n=1 Tax=Penicillium thymicola TaxID=293382 RepID=A0AAI9X9C1_PENTH|nr:hypothetical protein VN97_g5299 [Penicillium thymicola]